MSTSTSAVVPVAADGYRKDLQVLRGVAVLLVVVYHTGLAFPGGFVGVDVFLVISGYVITTMLLREIADTGRVSLTRFYLRRVRRLLPALAVVLCTTAFLSLLLENPGGPQQTTARMTIGAAVMVSNVVLDRAVGGYFAGSTSENPLLHTWSLSVEEQFYLAFPIALLALVALCRRRGPALIAITAAVTVSGFLLALAVGRGIVGVPLFSSSPSDATFYSPFTRVWEFGCGVVAALIVTQKSVRLIGPRAARFIGALMIAGSAVVADGSSFSALEVFPAVLGATLICLGVSMKDSYDVDRRRLAKWLAWIGDRSYGWYLWHWPLMVMAAAAWSRSTTLLVLVAVGSLVPALASYRWIELPLRRREPSLRRTLALGACCVVIPLLLGFGLGRGAQAGWGQDWALGAHQLMQRDCDDASIESERCRWPIRDSIGTVALIGDSQAWAIGDGVIEAGRQARLSTVSYVRNGCPFVLGLPSTFSVGCEQWSELVYSHLATVRPDVVVLANNSIGYVSDPETAVTWSGAIGETVRRLKMVSRGVILVGVIPQGDGEAVKSSLLLRPDRPRTTPMALQPPMRALVASEERRALSSVANVVWFDPASVLCDSSSCISATVTDELYVDVNHLSRPGALMLSNELKQVLLRLFSG